MSNLLITAILVGVLFVSTCAWAVRQARNMSEPQPSRGMVKARLWSAGISFVLIAVLVVVSGIALFSSGASGPERLVSAATSPVAAMGLIACAIVALYVVYLCARLWRDRDGRILERAHVTLHLGMVYAVVFLLLSLRWPAG